MEGANRWSGEAAWWRPPCGFPGQQHPDHGQARAGSAKCQPLLGGGFLQLREHGVEPGEQGWVWGQTGALPGRHSAKLRICSLGSQCRICFFLFCFNGIFQTSFSSIIYLTASGLSCRTGRVCCGAWA